MDQAIEAWTRVVGREHVLDCEPELRRAESATFATHQRVATVLRPFDRDEVRECLQIANRCAIPIYPISCGKNYGYGSRVPVGNENVLIDLGRLNRIHEVDEELGCITVEPGVTFQQVYDELQDRHSRYALAVTGGAPNGSLIGNAMERGFGVGPYGERMSHTCGLEVLLADGSCFHTGFGRFSNARASNVDRFGVGPSLDGLFTQSNLGIVTRMTFWLLPRAVDLRLLTFTLTDEQLPGGLLVLRELMLTGVVSTHSIGLLNGLRHASLMGAPIESEPTSIGGPWHCSLGLYSASSAIGRAAAEHVMSALAPHAGDIQWHCDRQNEFDGVPSWRGIHGWYCQSGVPIPERLDPEQDGCGLLWFGPVVPLRDGLILRVLRMMNSAVLRHGFEPHFSVVCVSQRSVILNLGIGYDRRQPQADERAHACYDEVLNKCIHWGCYPYRLPIHKMKSLPRADDDFDVVLSRIKQSLDPGGVLAPGRYDFRSENDTGG